MKIKASRKAHFNAAHRLYKKDWGDAKNFEVFGKCSNPNFHGHNYELIVSVYGEIDPATGFVIDLSILKRLIAEKVEAVLDHKNLNVEVSYFADKNPTVEHIAIFIYEQLRPFIEKEKELEITLFETPRNFVTYNGN